MESKKTKESPKAKFFNGYQNFSYQDAVWNGIFVKLPNEELKQLLQLQQIEIGDDTLSKKISGSRAWGDSGSCFLQWLSDEEAYEKNWLMPFRRMVKEKNIDVFKSIQVFRSFCESIPEEKDVSDFPGFLWPAQYTARYLHEVIRCCKAADRESKTDWVAAGAYVLICLVMQNGKEVEKNPWAFVFCRPPEKYDPCPDWEYGADNETPDSQVLMIPDEIPLSQDHYDFWAELRSYFPEKQDEKKLPEDDEIWRGQIKVITPAQVHRKRIRISREVDTLLYSWHIRCGAMFLIEEVPFWNKDQWNIAVRLCKLPWTEETKKHDKSAICLEEELKKIPDDGERTFSGQIPAVAVVSKDVTEIERQLYELPTAKIQLRKEIFSDQTT